MRKNLLTILCFLSLPATAMAEPMNNLATVDVLPGWRTADGDHMAGLRVTLAPGWKTYWRAPGDAGIPPHFRFTGSDNIAAVTPHWPVPQVFDQNGLRSIGYHDSVVVPLRLDLDEDGAPVQIAGEMHIGVCEEICVPVTLTFDTSLPTTGRRDTSITAALIDQPLSASEANVGDVTCAIEPIDDGLQVTANLQLASSGPEVVVIEAGDPSVWVSEADVSHTATGLSATVDMVHASGNSFALDRSAVRITVLGQDRAIDIHGCTAH